MVFQNLCQQFKGGKERGERKVFYVVFSFMIRSSQKLDLYFI